MEQVQVIKDTFAAYGPAAALRRSVAAACRGALLTVLDRLHLYSAPVIISAECVVAEKALLSGGNTLQG